MSLGFIGKKLKIKFWLLSILILISNNALSKVFNVNAEYKPAAYNIDYGANNFINTDKCTLPGSLCVINNGEYIFSLPIVANRAPIKTGSNRDYPLFMQVKPKKILLSHNITGQQYEMTLIPTIIGVDINGFSGFSSAYDLTEVLKLVEGDCYSDGFRGYGWHWTIKALFRVKGEQMLSGCYNDFKAKPQYGLDFKISEFYLGFRLKTPNPLKMKNGEYTGTLDLLISPNGDIDLGNGTYSSSHTFKFKLLVKNQIKIDILEDSKSVILKPIKGWWGGKQMELSNEISYSLWASSNVKVSLRCQYKFNDACGIKNEKDHIVGLNVYDLANGKERFLLTEKSSKTINVINPMMGVERKILFRVDNLSVTSMLKYPGSTYSGNVTIVYDASI